MRQSQVKLFGYGIVLWCYYNYSKYDREKAMSMPKIDAKSEDGANSSSTEREMNAKA